MTSPGYHQADVWMSIYFQIIHALYVMTVNGIYLREMTMEDNVYIKDLDTPGRPNGYWRYVVNGINYYIPNYGALVFIDSNFKDIVPGNTMIQTRRDYKIRMRNTISRNEPDNYFQDKNHENYRRIVSTNCFTAEHTTNNVVRPPETIMTMIGAMMTNQEKDLSIVLQTYFSGFMNNRIGTFLQKDIEVPHLGKPGGPFKKGEMVAEKITNETYRWGQINAIYSDGNVDIWTSEDNRQTFTTRKIRPDILYQYSPVVPLIQDTTIHSNFTADELIETYVISE
jgi:hypothetical protein